jgi:hypothetical protein
VVRSGRLSFRKTAARTAPFLITAVVLFAILRRYSVAEISTQVREGNGIVVVPCAIALTLLYISFTALADTMVLGCFGPVRYLDILRAKMGMAVLTSLGYAFGNGGYAVWIARATGAGARLGGALFAYFALAEIAALATVASLTLPFLGDDAPRALYVGAALGVAIPVLAVLIGPSAARSRLGAIVPRPWHEVPRRTGLLQIAVRCCAIVVAVVFTSVAARGFGLRIPLQALVTYVPVLLLLLALPINVGGFGAVQAAWLFFFLPWETGPRILAFHFLWNAALGIAIIVRGLPFLRRATTQIADGAPPDAAASGAVARGA